MPAKFFGSRPAVLVIKGNQILWTYVLPFTPSNSSVLNFFKTLNFEIWNLMLKFVGPSRRAKTFWNPSKPKTHEICKSENDYWVGIQNNSENWDPWNEEWMVVFNGTFTAWLTQPFVSSEKILSCCSRFFIILKLSHWVWEKQIESWSKEIRKK